jgi:hypothetical protein
MNRQTSPERHLDVRTVLDFLDGTIDAAGRRAAEEHLGRPCPTCRERLRALGEFLETMRLDRTPDVPAWLHERARAVFEPQHVREGLRPMLEALAELVFDSLAAPLPALARRSVGEARRLRYRIAEQSLDLELEREGAAIVSLRGSLDAPDAALWTVEVGAGGERFVARPDAAGAFAFNSLPLRPLDVSLAGPAGRFRIPAVEP